MDCGAEAKVSAVCFARSLANHPLVRAAMRPGVDAPEPRRHMVSRDRGDRRCKYAPASILAAVDQVLAAEFASGSVTRAARQHGIPRDLLSHYLSARGGGGLERLRQSAAGASEAQGFLTEARRHGASEAWERKVASEAQGFLTEARRHGASEAWERKVASEAQGGSREGAKAGSQRPAQGGASEVKL